MYPLGLKLEVTDNDLLTNDEENSLMEYKGYHAKIEFDRYDNLFVGSVIGINDSVSFHGTLISELRERFMASVDDYLELCQKNGREPDKEDSKKKLTVKVDPDIVKEASLLFEDIGCDIDTAINMFLVQVIRCDGFPFEVR